MFFKTIYTENKIDIETIDYFLLPNIDLKFQKESLDLLEIPENKEFQVKNLDIYQQMKF